MSETPTPTPVSGSTGPSGVNRTTPLLLGAALLGVVLVGAFLLLNQGGGGAPASPSPSAAASPSPAASPSASPSPSPSPSPPPSPSPSPSPSPAACAPANLTLITAGTLTIGTDNPAFPPYYAENADGSKTPPWELGQPMNGQGFESEVAYAIAEELGLTAEQVTWVVVPFTNLFAPGPKPFDFAINQVSFKEERAQVVDISDPYFLGNQAIVVQEDGPFAAATSLAELKDAVFGAQQGTTSYDAIVDVIQPSAQPMVFTTNDDAVEALGVGTIQALVVDVPTSDYITNVQVETATTVGQFSGGQPERYGVVLAKDSALTECVDTAIATLTDDGTLERIAADNLAFLAEIPVIE
jgi:polar amino acid transport system substrate-binding protein